MCKYCSNTLCIQSLGGQPITSILVAGAAAGSGEKQKTISAVSDALCLNLMEASFYDLVVSLLLFFVSQFLYMPTFMSFC